MDKNARYQNYVDAVSFIAESMIGNECINVTKPEVSLELFADRSNFKLYMGDTGLLVTQVMKNRDDSDEDLYKSLIVGNFLGSSALAAVSSSGNLIFLMVGFFNWNRHRIRCHRCQILRCQRHSESAEIHPYNRWLRTDLRRDPYHCRYHCRTTDPGAYGNTGGGTSKLDYLFPDLLYRLTCLRHVQLLCRYSAVRR